jgi:hypothetical protein
MLVWGNSSAANTGGQFDVVNNSWSAITTTNAPGTRIFHGAVWTGSRMLIWAGDSNNTGGQYDPVNDSWSNITTVNAPAGRRWPAPVWTGTHMLIFGGSQNGAANFYNNGGLYDPIADSWSQISSTNAPPGRYDHMYTWTGSNLIEWGGWNGAALNSGGVYDAGSNTWSLMSTTNAPSIRHNSYSFNGIWTGSKFIVFAGDAAGGAATLNTGAIYTLATNTWDPLPTTNAPSQRRAPVLSWVNQRNQMIVWSGVNSSGTRTNTGAIFDLANNVWISLSTVNAPQAVYYSGGIWTGSRFIGWGGTNGAGTNTGGLYDIGIADATGPVPQTVWSDTANGTYAPGSVIDVIIKFDETVFVSGSPQITLETGATDRPAIYSSGSSTDTLVFKYTTQAGDSSADLDYVSTSALDGANISDSAGNTVTTALPAVGSADSLGGTKDLVITP